MHLYYCLKDKVQTKSKIFHLKMLVHFIGDLHQPMHIGPKKIKGGNNMWNGLEAAQTYSVWG
jgi:hypothetical protein